MLKQLDREPGSDRRYFGRFGTACYYTLILKPGIVVVGALVMDLVATTDRYPEPGETVRGTGFRTYPGGKGANQAAAAVRMGARVEMVGRAGGDAFGQQLVDSLRDAGVGVSGVTIDPASSSGISLIAIDASAQNRIVQVSGANWACGESEVTRGSQALQQTSCLMLQLEVPLEVSMALARQASSAGKTVILDPGPARDIPVEFIRCCDYITPNETEAQKMVGFKIEDMDSARKAAEELLSRGAGCAIITMGARGAYYATTRGGRHVPAFPVQAVDTVAAGDAFNGALAVALAEGKGLDEALLWATAAGALAVTRHGAQDSMPSRQEVEAFLRGQ